jgi:acyl-CoA synthetase (AMP-forming)/AMP-acid ligase II
VAGTPRCCATCPRRSRHPNLRGARPDGDVTGHVYVVGGRCNSQLGPVGKVNLTVAARVVDEDMDDVPTSLDLRDLDQFLTELLARYKHPKALEIVDARPRNPPKKSSRRNCRHVPGPANSLTQTKVPLHQRFQ